MRAQYKQFGVIKEGTICFGKGLTLLTGENNSGKTFAMNTAYNFAKNKGRCLAENLLQYLSNNIKQNESTMEFLWSDFFVSDNFGPMKFTRGTLSNIFYVNEDHFDEDTDVQYNLEHVDYQDIIGWMKEQDERTIESSQLQIKIGAETFKISLVDDNQSLTKIFEKNHHMIVRSMTDFFKQYRGFAKPYFLPAERIGINKFYQELSSDRNNMYEAASKLMTMSGKQKQNNAELLDTIFSLQKSRYAESISDYIMLLNRLNTNEMKKKKNKSYQDELNYFKKNIIGGKYIYSNDGINVKMHGEKKSIPFHISSSLVNSLVGIDILLNYEFDETNYLFIDEPELNLHPQNQVYFVQLLAMLVNKGLNIVISTHSDYIVNAVNNLIKLATIKQNDNAFVTDKLYRKYKLNTNTYLNIDDVSAYMFEKGTIRQVSKDKEFGLELTTFNKAIDEIYEFSDKLDNVLDND